jgi:photosystem II stability/assembly factor-like uncharacterized protein
MSGRDYSTRLGVTRRLPLTPLLALLIVASAGAQVPMPSRTRAPRPPLPAAIQDGEALAERERDVGAREHWFVGQRSFPTGTIPADGRARAWAARRNAKRSVGYWRPIGPSPTVASAQLVFEQYGAVSGRINSIAIAPRDPGVVLVGASTGGIWRSADGGATFVPVSDAHVDLGVGSVAFAPSDGRIAYAAMGDKVFQTGTGILKSTDAGVTWSRVDTFLDPNLAPGHIVVDPRDPNRLYLTYVGGTGCGTPGQECGGVWRSTDGGASWSRVLPGRTNTLILDPRDPSRLYAGVKEFVSEAGEREVGGVFLSSDSGTTWRRVYRTPYVSPSDASILAVAPSDPRRLYLLTGGYGGETAGYAYHIVESTDGGETWNAIPVPESMMGQFGYNNCLAVDPRDARTLYMGTVRLYKSADAGRSWTCLDWTQGCDGEFRKIHADQHVLLFHPADPTTLYIGNDGGLFRTRNGGASFESLNETLSLTQMVGYAMHPTNPAIAYAGTQDNGTQRWLGGPQWEMFQGGDGGHCVVDSADPTIVYASFYYGYINRWQADGTRVEMLIADNATFGEPAISPRMAFYPPFTGNGANSNLYFGTWRLFRSDDRGASWYAPSGTLDLAEGDMLTAIGVSRSNPEVIFVGTSSSHVWLSRNGGRTWTEVPTGLPRRFVTSLTVHPTDPATAFVTFSGYGAPHVFKTVSSGASWTNITSDLPDVPVNALLIDPIDDRLLYAGTDIGVFRYREGEGWTFMAGMPPVIVTALASGAGGAVHAATYGRGAYELVRVVDTTAPTVTVTAPNGGERFTAGSTLTVTWQADDDYAVRRQMVLLSLDAGATFPITVATDLDGSARSASIRLTKSMKSRNARVRVVAIDESGNEGVDASDASFRIAKRRP